MSTTHTTALSPSSPSRPLQQPLAHSRLQNASPGTPRTFRKPASRIGPGIGKFNTASTPNLRAQITNPSSAAPPIPLLLRKASQPALTSTSLAALPDASGSYALATLSSPSRSNKMVLSPLTPRAGAMASDTPAVGDTVDVPGNMYGTVRFIGTVQGKKGTFAGVELHPEFASRGKNNGDVDGYVGPADSLSSVSWGFVLFC